MKICVIGTSHSACMYEAWQTLAERYPGADVTFFMRPGNYFDHFSTDPERGLLSSANSWTKECLMRSSGGNGDIDFNTFDTCLVIGGFGHLSVSMMAQLGGQAKAGFSKQAIAAAMKDLYGASHVSVLFPKIRAVSNIPVHHFQDPITAHIEGLSPPEMDHRFKPYDYNLGAKLLQKTVLSPLKVELVKQRPETLAAENWTRFELCVGKRKPLPAEIKAGFKGAYKEDRGHMKPEFGRLRLEAFMAQLGVERQGSGA